MPFHFLDLTQEMELDKKPYMSNLDILPSFCAASFSIYLMLFIVHTHLYRYKDLRYVRIHCYLSVHIIYLSLVERFHDHLRLWCVTCCAVILLLLMHMYFNACEFRHACHDLTDPWRVSIVMLLMLGVLARLLSTVLIVFGWCLIFVLHVI